MLRFKTVLNEAHHADRGDEESANTENFGGIELSRMGSFGIFCMN